MTLSNKRKMTKSWSYIWLIFLFITLQLNAQYFGRNKVQYEDFDFEVLETENFNIYYYPDEKAVTQDAARMLKRWYARYTELFDYELRKKQPVIIYANHPDFQQTNVISGLIPQGTGGVTEGMRNRMVIPMTGVYDENDHVLGHELVHAFHYDVMKRLKGGLRASRQIPLWLIEGMAEYLTKGRKSELTSMWMRDAVLQDKVPTIDQITRQARYFPYRYGHALWAYIAANWGDDIVLPLFSAVAGQDWQTGARKVLKINSDTLSRHWQESIKNTYEPQIQDKTKPSEIGQAIIREAGEINLAPVLSPDGKYMVFISRRNLFTLDLYLANVETGEIMKKLTSFKSDVHFDNLRFMNSSGTWSPDSRTVAFVVVRKGDNQIALFDLKEKRVKRLIKIPEVTGIMHLNWSPMGDKLAFFGTSGGVGNLYLLDLNTEKVTKLTDDRYAEIQPHWHPDGNRIAFATDRGAGTSLEDLTFSELKIGIINVNDGRISLLSMGPQTKHINPQFDSTGQNIYFVASPDGFSNIYRYNFNKKEYYKITNVATGVSGLTKNSPAISLSRNSSQLVMSVFDDHDYRIYGLDIKENKGDPYDPGSQSTEYPPGALPPVERSDHGIVQTYLRPEPIDKKSAKDFTYHDYTPRLKLYYAGRSMIGGTVDQYGVGLGGNINLYFSDILGNHILLTNFSAQGNLKDLGGEVMYRNRDHRLNWGADIGHIGYNTGYTTSQLDSITGNGGPIPAKIYRRYNFYTYNDRVRGLLEFPLNRNQRIEAAAGLTRIGYDREVEIVETTLNDQVIDRRTKKLENPPAVYLFHPSLAVVGDWSYSGFTSPARGRRYRFELEGTTGSLRYLSALGDYRYYHFINPVTLAARFLHYGRYFMDADSKKLTPLQLGYESWVRGYSPQSFKRSECTKVSGIEECPEFDRLTGSRIGVFNAEIRLPLLGTEQFGLINFRYLPTEILAFVDGGVAWTEQESPVLKWDPHSKKRVPVFSTGVGARFNILGYVVVQAYYAYPFQRPKKGAHFGFVFAPGW